MESIALQRLKAVAQVSWTGVAVAVAAWLWQNWGVIAPPPQPPAPPKPAPVVWVVTDSAGQVVKSPELVAAAQGVACGNYKVIGYPEAGTPTVAYVVVSGEIQPNPEPQPPAPPPQPQPPAPDSSLSPEAKLASVATAELVRSIASDLEASAKLIDDRKIKTVTELSHTNVALHSATLAAWERKLAGVVSPTLGVGDVPQGSSVFLREVAKGIRSAAK